MGVGEWAPLVSKDLKHNGVISRIVEESFAYSNIRVKHEWVPWKRAYYNVAVKHWDLSPGYSKNPEREAEVLFSDPLFEKYQVFFHLKTYLFNWNSYDDLKGLRIGATGGYYYGKVFENAGKTGSLAIEYVPTDLQNLRKLLHGRIQIFPMNILTGYSFIQKQFPPQQAALFTHHPKKLAPPNKSYVVFSKNERGRKLARIFNKGLKELKASGKYQRYFEESNRGEYKK
jgi:polar amino acid transport system substrate-binding protein